MSVQGLPTNPLLDFTGLPKFSAIRPEHVEPALNQVLAENRARVEHLLAVTREFTWDDFVQPLEDMDERLGRMWSPVTHLNSVMDNEALREVYDRCLPKLSEYQTELAQDERLYRGYKAVADHPDYGHLTQAQRKIVENTLRDFRLSGAELSASDKQRFKAIQQELAALNNRFSQNVLDATQAWALWITGEEDLAGLPESARAVARQAAQEDGKRGWKFTLDGPAFVAFMSYADNRELRRQMYEAYYTRASDQGPHAGRWDNGEIIVRVLTLRQEAARLLGFENYAAYSLAPKMAQSVEQVLGFLRDLVARAKPVAEKELDELRQFARDEAGLQSLEAWDIPYYSEKLREARYAISQQDLRPYFPVPHVVHGMFRAVKRLYGVEIREIIGIDTWHPDVSFYEIRDENGQLRGRFYLDLYTRAHKRGGAWMDQCVPRKRSAAGVQTPVAYLTCNFSPPVDARVSLLTHSEVITLFHEFGHGLHHLLTTVDHVGVAGINGVEWDAVELPSQFMENWCWQREALDLFARHYETNECLPGQLYEKMIAAKNFQSAMQMVRQIEFALFDMRLHGEFEAEADRTVQDYLDEVRREVAVVVHPPFNRFQNSFNHIFAGGYAAGYYSYKWAEVLAADAFSLFEERGVFDRETGQAFFHKILEQGGSREAMRLFVDFRGREPKIDALLRHSGLAAEGG